MRARSLEGEATCSKAPGKAECGPAAPRRPGMNGARSATAEPCLGATGGSNDCPVRIEACPTLSRMECSLLCRASVSLPTRSHIASRLFTVRCNKCNAVREEPCPSDAPLFLASMMSFKLHLAASTRTSSKRCLRWLELRRVALEGSKGAVAAWRSKFGEE